MLRWTAAITAAALLFITIRPAAAQSAEPQPILPDSAISGAIAAAGDTADYTFPAVAGEIISVLVTATDPAFDPIVTLLEGERVLIGNDDYAYPDSRDALLEAVTLPRTGTYTIRIGGFATATGSFTLTLRRGFTGLGVVDDFSTNTGWSVSGEGADIRLQASALNLRYTGQGFAAAFPTAAPTFVDYYGRVAVTVVRPTTGNWIAGIAAQYPNGGYYALQVRGDGAYRFIRQQDATTTTLRDWVQHPAIIAGQTRFTLALLARSGGFHLFYNDSPLFTVSADAALTGQARIGVSGGIAAALPTDAELTFDDLAVTTPGSVNAAPIIPDQVIIGDGTAMATALTRRHVVRADGQMALTVPESTVQFARIGVNRLMVGGGVTYENFAIGATVRIQANTAGLSACGLVVRSTSEDDYALLYAATDGSAELTTQTDGAFAPGVFVPGTDAPAVERHLLIIADGTTLYGYLDGRSIGTLTVAAAPGEVGGAVVNYEAADTVCTFRNLWVWSWAG